MILTYLEKTHYVTFLFLLWSQTTSALELNFPPGPRLLKKLAQKTVIASSEVNTVGQNQSLDLKVYGLHPKSCQYSLSILSRYEDYDTFIDFIKEANYQEKDQKLYFLFKSAILPFPLVLDFKMARITKPGTYSFTFTKGFLKDLLGKIQVKDFKGQCLYYLNSTWNGPNTKIPDLILEIFTQTLSQIGLYKLIRISR